MESFIYTVLLIFLVTGFILDSGLEWLNIRNLKPTLPEIMKPFYNENKYRKSVNYEKTNTTFSFFSHSFSFILIMAMLLLGGFSLLDQWVTSITASVYGRSALFFGVLFLVSDLLSIPFQYYHTFVIEEKFGFNKSSLKTFVFDKLKGWVITAMIGGGLLMFLLWAFMATGIWFFLIFMAGITIFSITITLFYTKLIVPIFNKITPLPQGELAEAIRDFALQHQFSVKEVSVIDGSKRSTKANAYFSGFGSRKRIILYDTLITDLSVDEIVAVLAHEMGHSKNRHVLKGMALSLLQTGIMVALLAWALRLPELSHALGINESQIYINLLVFGLLYTPVAELLGMISNLFSRKFEYEADEYVTRAGIGPSLINALIQLSINNLNNLQPHPWYVFVHFSHPTLLQRMNAIKTSSYKN